ncbi:MAG: alpha/beta hydrolase [Candidatus Shapirobacteria bacterium]|jgi:pimeloyl-ACP methyl ester carboxylesterase
MDIVINNNLVHFDVINPQAQKTCLILHGWNHHSQLWQDVAQNLPPSYRYLLLDLPGFGNSPLLPETAGIPEYADFILNFIKKNNLKNPIVIGHSFGGQIAAYLAIKNPHLFSGLILISPSINRFKSTKQKLKIFIYHRFNFLKKILPSKLLRLVLSQITSTDYYNSSPAHQNILKKIVNHDLTKQLGQIQTPTFIIWGENDTEIPYSGQVIANQIKNSRLYLLHNANHNPHLDPQSQLVPTLKHIFNQIL